MITITSIRFCQAPPFMVYEDHETSRRWLEGTYHATRKPKPGDVRHLGRYKQPCDLGGIPQRYHGKFMILSAERQSDGTWDGDWKSTGEMTVTSGAKV